MNIAAELWRIAVKDPKKINANDFLLHFEKPKPKVITPEHRKNVITAAKAVWKMRTHKGA